MVSLIVRTSAGADLYRSFALAVRRRVALAVRPEFALVALAAAEARPVTLGRWAPRRVV
jgi:hypothetical protein